MTGKQVKPRTTAAVPRTLGVFSLVMINVVAVDSLRTLPFSAEFGLSLIFYYVLASITFFLPIALVATELATAWPNKGGVYIWVREAFGPRWSFVIIWLQWVYNVVWYPTILSFVAGALAYLVSPHLAESRTYILATVLSIFWIATLVNFLGMRLSSAVSTFCALVGALIPMGLLIVLGIVWWMQGQPMATSFSWSALMPHLTHLENLVFLTAVLFGLVGMELSATHADEVKNPGYAYPRAILYSAVIIFVTLVGSSLVIAMIVPHKQLSVMTGVEQALTRFFGREHHAWINVIATLLIAIGGIGTVAAWIIGPTKGMLVAVRDGSAPMFFGRVNRKGVPVVILLMQGIIFTVLCSVFVLMPTVNSSYWILTAMTAQLAMLVYIGMFAAAIWLRYKYPNVTRPYCIWGGNATIWIIGLLGISSCVFAILLGFLPPDQIKVGNLAVYELILVLGIVLLSVPPLVIYRWNQKRQLLSNSAE